MKYRNSNRNRRKRAPKRPNVRLQNKVNLQEPEVLQQAEGPVQPVKVKSDSGPLIALILLMLFVAVGIFVVLDQENKARKSQSSQAKVEEEPKKPPLPIAPKPKPVISETEVSEPKVIEPVPVEESVVREVPISYSIIQQAGKANGKPDGPDDGYISSEYSLYRSKEQVYKTSVFSEIPQVLGAGQAIQFELKNLKKINMQFKVLLNTASPRSGRSVKEVLERKPKIRIVLGERVIYDRVEPNSNNLVSAFISADWLDGTFDVLTVSNDSKVDVGIDTLWLEEFVPREKVWVGLEDAEWLDKKRSVSLSHMVVHLSSNSGYIKPEAWEKITSLTPISCGSIENRQNDWLQEDWNNLAEMSGLSTEEQLRERADDWKKRIGNILGRGAEPVVILNDADYLRPQWMQLYAVFRHYVKYWFIESRFLEKLPNKILKMKELNPEVDITVMTERQAKVPKELFEVAKLSVPATSEFVMNEKLGVLRQFSLRNNVGYPHVLCPALLSNHFRGIRGLEANYRNAYHLSNMLVGWLHEGESRVVVSGGNLGESIFPERASDPMPIWSMLKHITPVGQGQGTRLPCNVVLYDSSDGLTDASWCASQNSDSQVTILVASKEDVNRDIRVDVLVPWNKGPTEVEIAPLSLYENRPLEEEAAEVKSVSVQPTGKYGTVSFFTRLKGLLHIRMRPSGAKWYRPSVRERTPDKEKRITFDRSIAYLRDSRFPSEAWVEALGLFTIPGNCVVSNPKVSSELIVATPGSFNREQMVVPWNSQSLLISYDKDPVAKEEKIGAMIHIYKGNFRSAKYMDIWVYPRAEGGQKTVSFNFGTDMKRATIRLSTERWQCVRLPFKHLLPAESMGTDFQLKLWPSVEDCRRGNVSFELNALDGVGTTVNDGEKPSKYAELIEVSDPGGGSQFFLYGPVGQPAIVDQMVKLKLQDGMRANLKYYVNVAISPPTQRLRACIKKMPSAKEFDLGDEIVKLPEEYRKKVRKGQFNAIPISFRLKRKSGNKKRN